MNRSFLLLTSFSWWITSCAVDVSESDGTSNAIQHDELAEALGTSSIKVFKNVKSGKCIGVDGASLSSDALIQQFDCDPDAPNQAWIVADASGSADLILNVKSTKCMGVDSASKSPGADIKQYDCSKSMHPNQLWHAGTGPNPWHIRNAHSRLCIGVDRASVDNGAQLKQFPCDGALNQSWMRSDW